MTPEQYAVVKGFEICFNCLFGSHLIRDCKNQANKTCGKAGCDKHHHQLLHRDDTVSCTFEEFLESTLDKPVSEAYESSETEDVSNHIITGRGTSVNIF